MPVAPTGWPFDFRPPDGLTGIFPPSAVSPDPAAAPPLPRGTSPSASITRISAIVKQSWTSQNEMSFGPIPACL